MANHELGIIGSGNMAQAIVRGATGAGFLPAGAIVASDVAPAQREAMARLGVAAVEDNAIPAACPRVLLAVKPQQMKDVLAALTAKAGAGGGQSPTSPGAGALTAAGTGAGIRTDATVISIAAGVRTARLDEWLGRSGRLVRVMPNTPMLVGAGMSALAAGPRATEADLAWTEGLFASCGRTVRVGEELIDAVTAVSGSGPAYLFYLVEAMIAAGVAEGLPADTARLLACQACLGAAKLLIESGETPQTLRARVTSPGGTTERAIETMESAGVKDALLRAIRAVAARSRDLGK